MSNANKETVKKVNETFKRIQREADDASKKVSGFDKDLATKIQRVKEGSGEVVRHVEKRLDNT